MCSESLKTEAVYTNTEMNTKLNVNFLQNSPVAIQSTYSWQSSDLMNIWWWEWFMK